MEMWKMLMLSRHGVILTFYIGANREAKPPVIILGSHNIWNVPTLLFQPHPLTEQYPQRECDNYICRSHGVYDQSPGWPG